MVGREEEGEARQRGRGTAWGWVEGKPAEGRRREEGYEVRKEREGKEQRRERREKKEGEEEERGKKIKLRNSFIRQSVSQ